MYEPTILEAAAVPRLRCSTCGTELMGQGWFEHNDDGSHTFTPAALTPLAPEVPPRRDAAYLVEQVNAMPVLKVSGEALSETLAETTGVVGADQFFCDWDEQEWFVAQSGVLALLESAATRTPEPPDSGPLDLGVPTHGHTIVHSHGQQRHVHTIDAEPPDSGDGAARSRSVIRRENVQAGRPMNEGIEPRDAGDGAALPDDWDEMTEGEKRRFAASRTTARCEAIDDAWSMAQCGLPLGHAGLHEARSGSPAPEGGE